MSAPRHYDPLFVGDLAPRFRQRCIGEDAFYSFDMAAGRVVAMLFYGSARQLAAQHALRLAAKAGAQFDPARIAMFGVSNDPADDATPGLRHFADADGVVGRAFGLLPREGSFEVGDLRRGWIVLDPRLRVVAQFPLEEAGNAAAMRFLRDFPAAPPNAQVPVLAVPGVFEPAFCERMIRLHQSQPAIDSAIMTEHGAVRDHGFKRRSDWRMTDAALIAQVQSRIFRRVVPELRHAFQFNATRLERLIVACYDADQDGRFGPHRDNTIAATAHRRFAISINLNHGFEGGGLGFPEYGPRVFVPKVGEALVFSCSLLHEVLPMRHGRRYACLPFVYDDAAAAHRRRGGA